jgi:hypothetical protein
MTREQILQKQLIKWVDGQNENTNALDYYVPNTKAEYDCIGSLGYVVITRLNFL